MSQAQNIAHIKTIFPDLDDETITSVLSANRNNVERAVNYLLGIEDGGGAGGDFGGGDFGGGNFGGGNYGRDHYQQREPVKPKSADELYKIAKIALKQDDEQAGIKNLTAVLEAEVMSQRSINGLKGVKNLIKILSAKKSEREVRDYLTLVLSDYLIFLENNGWILTKIFYYISLWFNIAFQQEAFLIALDKISLPELLPYLRESAILVQFGLDSPKLDWFSMTKIVSAYPKARSALLNEMIHARHPFNYEGNELVMTGKIISISSMIFLATALKSCDTIHTISFTEETKFDLGCARLLADACTMHPTLRNVRLQDCSVGFEGGALLMNALSTCQLTSLSLDYVKLSSKTLIKIPETLINLDLSNNNLGQAGARQLAKIIKKTKIESLAISGDLTVGNDGVLLLFGALKKNATLKQLNISYTDIEDEAISVLLQGFADRKGFTVDIRGNDSLSKPMIAACKASQGIKFITD